MSAFGSVDAFWYVVAGAMVAVGGLLVYWFRRAFRWLGQRLKTGYLDWFAEAVDAHVAPMIDAVKENSSLESADIQRRATEADDRVAAVALEAAAEVKEQLRLHTQEEGEVVQKIIKREIVPVLEQIADIQTTVTEHLKSDEVNFAAAGAALTAGQEALVGELQAIKSAIEGTNP